MVTQVPSALRHSDIVASLTRVVDMLDETSEPTPEFWRWFAGMQVAQQYSQVQAEHWWQVWRQQLDSSSTYIVPVDLPQLPEPLR